MDCYQRIKALVNDIDDVMDNIFSSGFATIGVHTVEKARRIAIECSNSGLDYAAEALSKIADEMDERRHTMAFDFADVTEVYCILNQYVSIIKSKIDFLMAEESIKSAK